MVEQCMWYSTQNTASLFNQHLALNTHFPVSHHIILFLALSSSLNWVLFSSGLTTVQWAVLTALYSSKCTSSHFIEVIILSRKRKEDLGCLLARLWLWPVWLSERWWSKRPRCSQLFVRLFCQWKGLGFLRLFGIVLRWLSMSDVMAKGRDRWKQPPETARPNNPSIYLRTTIYLPLEVPHR